MYNGMEEIYVNAEARDGSDISELMRVFTEGDTYSQKFPVTSELKKLYREGDAKMIRTLSDDLREEGLAEGLIKGRVALLLQMLMRGNAPETIAEMTGVPVEELLEIQQAHLAN